MAIYTSTTMVIVNKKLHKLAKAEAARRGVKLYQLVEEAICTNIQTYKHTNGDFLPLGDEPRDEIAARREAEEGVRRAELEAERVEKERVEGLEVEVERRVGQYLERYDRMGGGGFKKLAPRGEFEQKVRADIRRKLGLEAGSAAN